MSKQMNSPLDQHQIRRHLLISVSLAALMAWSVQSANAADADRPLLWFEVGSDASMVTGEGTPFTAPFMTTYASSPIFEADSPVDIQKSPPYSFGGEAAISFQPENSNWIFSASIKYGRSNNNRKAHEQTHGLPVPTTSGVYQFNLYYGAHVHYLTVVEAYAHDQIRHSEKHEILDFQAGKDVGLGIFGQNSTSIISAGVRMARFDSHANAKIWARPYVTGQFNHYYPKYTLNWRNFYISGDSARGFHGLGPSLSWSGSVPIAGNTHEGELALDWGINAALLFGKQTARVHHQSSGKHISLYNAVKYNTLSSYHHTPPASIRSRNVTVPNLGGYGGISYQFVDAKVSLGYRYDTFLGAMDTGIDTAKKSAMTFKGPYASISIGLGD